MRNVLVILVIQSLLELTQSNHLTRKVTKYSDKLPKGKRLRLMEYNEYYIPRLKYAYLLETFTNTYQKIHHRPFIPKKRNKPEFGSEALYFLKYITSYTPQLNHVIPMTIFERILDIFMGQFPAYSGLETQKALIKLGGKAINSFAEFINDTIYASDIPRISLYHFTKDPCEWVPLLEIFPIDSLSIVSLVEITNNRRTRKDRPPCDEKFEELIERNLKFLLPRRKEYHISSIVQNFKKELKINREQILARWLWNKDKESLVYCIEKAIVPYEPDNSKDMCYDIFEHWGLELTNQYRVCESKIIFSLGRIYKNEAEKEKYSLLPKKGDSFRSNPALTTIYRHDNEFKDKVYTSVAFGEQKEITLSRLEYAFNQFVTIFKNDEEYYKYCDASKIILKDKNIKPFWNRLHKHFVPIEEVSKILCGSMEAYITAQEVYREYYYSHLHMKSNDDITHNIPIVDTEDIKMLRSINALGVYITDCVVYNFKSQIEELFALGITIDKFLAYDELHFFLLDAKQDMLLFFVEKIDFSTLSSDRAYRLWERILFSASKFSSEDKTIFFQVLLTLPSKSSEEKLELNATEEHIDHSYPTEEISAASNAREETTDPPNAMEKTSDAPKATEEKSAHSNSQEEKLQVDLVKIAHFIRSSNQGLKDYRINRLVRKWVF